MIISTVSHVCVCVRALQPNCILTINFDNMLSLNHQWHRDGRVACCFWYNSHAITPTRAHIVHRFCAYEYILCCLVAISSFFLSIILLLTVGSSLWLYARSASLLKIGVIVFSISFSIKREPTIWTTKKALANGQWNGCVRMTVIEFNVIYVWSVDINFYCVVIIRRIMNTKTVSFSLFLAISRGRTQSDNEMNVYTRVHFILKLKVPIE